MISYSNKKDSYSNHDVVDELVGSYRCDLIMFYFYAAQKARSAACLRILHVCCLQVAWALSGTA